LLRLVEPALRGVGTRANRLERFAQWLDQLACAHCSLAVPADCALRRPFGLLFNWLVSPWAHTTRIVHESAHFANFRIGHFLLSRSVDDRGQETRWNGRHRHFLQTRVGDYGRSAPGRHCLHNCDRIDDRSRSFVRTGLTCHAGHTLLAVNRRKNLVTSGARPFELLSAHLNLGHRLIHIGVLLSAHVDVTVVLGEEFVIRLHPAQLGLLFKDAHLAVVLARPWSLLYVLGNLSVVCSPGCLVKRSVFLGPEHRHELLVLARVDIVLPWANGLCRSLVDEVYIFGT